MTHLLRYVRGFSALLFFCAISVLFVDYYEIFVFQVKDSVLYLQFMPSVIHFKNSPAMASAGFLWVLAVTFIFGRLYCSVICPLGVFQDLILLFQRKVFRKKFPGFFPSSKIRYVILAIALISLLMGNMVIFGVLDPFSDFGKFMTAIIRPLGISLNNSFSTLLEYFKVYVLFQIPYPVLHQVSLFFVLGYLSILMVMTFKRGRIYCNTLCPVGALLGLVSKHSLYRISIDKNSCVQCRQCEGVCKASCISSEKKEVDTSRCVTCFNCIGSCPHRSIHYEITKVSKPSFNSEKRSFLKSLFFQGIAFMSFFRPSRAWAISSPGEASLPVCPPGAGSLRHLTENCISCHLCIGVCPSNVLEPAFLDYGINGMLAPIMNYDRSFCNYECFKCSQICPTGAIKRISKSQKTVLQIGKAAFYPEKCIVNTNNTACGACAEICPTQAVHMVPYKNGLTLPEMEAQYCVGCGACQFACPALPDKAILVHGNAVHETAKKRQEVKKPSDYNAVNDFPF